MLSGVVPHRCLPNTGKELGQANILTGRLRQRAQSRGCLRVRALRLACRHTYFRSGKTHQHAERLAWDRATTTEVGRAYVAMCCILLFSAVLCCAVLCCAVLCCAGLGFDGYAVLYCSVLYYNAAVHCCCAAAPAIPVLCVLCSTAVLLQLYCTVL